MSNIVSDGSEKRQYVNENENVVLTEGDRESWTDAGMVQRTGPEFTLSENHHEHLKTSGLSDETIQAAGFYSVNEHQARELGFPGMSGLLIPYPGVPDYCRLRPDNPTPDSEGKTPKYLSRKGSQNQLYVPPGVESVLKDKTRLLLITEGEKKALKATQEGFPTIGLSGVWNWKTKDEGVLPALKQIKWKGRPVYIAFDSDLHGNSEVQAALRELVQVLEDWQAKVRIIQLPGGPDGQKVGLDDFLVQHSAAELQWLIDAAPDLLDSALTLIEPGLSNSDLQRRLEDVYRTANLYPASTAPFIEKLRNHATQAGYTLPAAGEIKKAIRRVPKFKSSRTEDQEQASKQLEPQEAAETMLTEQFMHEGWPTVWFYQGSVHQWQGTHYTELADYDLECQVMRWLQHHKQTCKLSFARDVVANLKAKVHLQSPLRPTFRIDRATDGFSVGPYPVLAFQNCSVPLNDLLNGTISQDTHTPEVFNTHALPYSYDPAADCPGWNKFIAEVLSGDCDRLKLVQEMFGYCLMGDLRYQKFFILHGEGSNGKSVVLEVLQAMLGDANVSHLPLDRFTDRFSLGSMEGKLANIYPDLDEIERCDEGILKTLTAGECVDVDRKYKEPRPMKPTAVLVFSTNNLPALRDRSKGIWRRLVVIPFDVEIPESRQDKQLSSKLLKELPGILNWALQGLYRLQQNKAFTQSQRCKDAASQHRRDSDHLLQFFDDCTRVGQLEVVPSDQLYRRYTGWVEEHGHKPLSNANFGKALRQYYPHVQRRERQIASFSGKRQKQYEYAGIGLLS